MNNYFRYLNQKCPICENKFASDDDIVVCPLCGTPHHRECYKKNGECGNYDEHNKGFHWTPVENPATENANEQTQDNANEQTPPFLFWDANQRPYSQFPPEIAPDVTTQEAADFVQSKGRKYIQNFFYEKSNRKAFNWAGFIFTPYWFFYRKMYKLGAIFLAITLLLSVGASYLPPIQKLNNALDEIAIKYEDVSEFTEDEIMSFYDEQTKMYGENKVGIVLLFAQGALSLALQIFVGFKANKWYYNHTVENITKIKRETDDVSARRLLFFKSGGVSIGHTFLAILINNIIVMGIDMFVGFIN